MTRGDATRAELPAAATIPLTLDADGALRTDLDVPGARRATRA